MPAIILLFISLICVLVGFLLLAEKSHAEIFGMLLMILGLSGLIWFITSANQPETYLEPKIYTVNTIDNIDIISTEDGLINLNSVSARDWNDGQQVQVLEGQLCYLGIIWFETDVPTKYVEVTDGS